MGTQDSETYIFQIQTCGKGAHLECNHGDFGTYKWTVPHSSGHHSDTEVDFVANKDLPGQGSQKNHPSKKIMLERFTSNIQNFSMLFSERKISYTCWKVF
jgi:hypothetical protein